MSVRTSARYASYLSLLSIALSGCFAPPYNNFQKDNRSAGKTAQRIGVGVGAGALAGAVFGSPPAGAIIGGATGTLISAYKNRKAALIKRLSHEDIEFIRYGDTITLIVPTDHYYLFESPRLNDICYPGLNDIVKLIQNYPCTPIYVAVFTDEVGTRHHKNMLSQAQAETMITFLWASGIPAQRLHAEGYGSQHAVGDNHWIHGSAFNRRIEIQWLDAPSVPQTAPLAMK